MWMLHLDGKKHHHLEFDRAVLATRHMAIRGECSCGGGFMVLVRPEPVERNVPTGAFAAIGGVVHPILARVRDVVPRFDGAHYDFAGVTKATACPAVAACRRFEEECVK